MNPCLETIPPTGGDACTRALWFPNEHDHTINIEQSSWWRVHDQLRDALAHCSRLEAEIRELKDRGGEMKAELLLLAKPPKTGARRL